MTATLKEHRADVAASSNHLLDRYNRSMATIWNTPEMHPFPPERNLPEIFDNLLRLCQNGLPRPAVVPDEDAELSVMWEEGDKAVILLVDTVRLTAAKIVSCGEAMEYESEDICLRTAQDWNNVEKDVRDVLGYRTR